jgi:hypothetical protein
MIDDELELDAALMYEEIALFDRTLDPEELIKRHFLWHEDDLWFPDGAVDVAIRARCPTCRHITEVRGHVEGRIPVRCAGCKRSCLITAQCKRAIRPNPMSYDDPHSRHKGYRIRWIVWTKKDGHIGRQTGGFRSGES